MAVGERPRVVSTMHGLHSVSAYSEIMCKAERVITVSKTVRAYILANYPKTDSTKLRVINRGIDHQEYPRGYQADEQWQQAWQQEYPQLRGKRLICLAGRLTRLKGHEVLLDIMARLRKQVPDVHAIIVGPEDPKRIAYAQSLYQRVAAEGLSDVVTFTGGRGDMREVYSQAALVLSLSTKPESFGRTTTEALSMGVPVVGFDHGAVGEQLQQLFPRGAVPCFDTEILYQRCLEALQKEAVPRENHVYLKHEMIEQTLALYRELL